MDAEITIIPPDSIHSTQLPNDVELLQQMVIQLLESLGQSQRKIHQLDHRLRQLLIARFGSRSEKMDRNQLLLFATQLLAGTDEESAVEVEVPEKQKKKKKKQGHGRNALPDHLPRKRIEHDLPDDQKICPCCDHPLIRIGQEISEQLEYIPASLLVYEHVRYKYACNHCEEAGVQTADKSEPHTGPIDKGLPGPGLLAQIIVSKYADHLPLNRQTKILKRHGVHIPRSTQCDWVAQCAGLLQPLYRLMNERIKQSKVIHTDDTPTPVLDKNRSKTKTGRFWVYCGDEDHPYTAFDYTPTRQGAGPGKWLGKFHGYLQADAYGGYDALYESEEIIEVACWAHTRRYFYESRYTAPALAYQAMAFISKLYKIEKQAKEQAEQATIDEPDKRRPLLKTQREELRQENARPLLDQLHEWLIDQRQEVLPKSPISKAINYALSNWKALNRYVKDGDLAIDNNISERAIRGIAIGRKNWMFAGSDQGGRTAAILFSFVRSCERHKIDPFAWFRDVLTKIPATPITQLTQFLPDQWQVQLNQGQEPKKATENWDKQTTPNQIKQMTPNQLKQVAPAQVKHTAKAAN